MENTSKKKSGLKNINLKNSYPLIILGLAAGVTLIILSFVFGESGGNPPENSLYVDLSRSDSDTYISEQEKKLAGLIDKISGLSDASVMITLDSSSEYIYASKQQIKENETKTKDSQTTNKDVQREVILYKDSSNSESPILVKEIQPKIKGVAVVCKGLNSAAKELEVINLIVAVLNLPTNRICVLSAD